jgi:ribokinase
VTAPRIVVVGSTMVDLVAFADRLPEAGETLVGTRFLQGFGGKGANQAVMAARFGAQVALVAAVGADPNGAAIVANLRDQGVAVDDIATVDATSGVAPIWVDGTGMNRIIIVPGANRLVDGAAAAAAVARIRPAVVVGQLEIPQATTVAGLVAARTVGATTILNPAPGAALEPGLVAASDWLVPNETEFVAIGGRPLVGDGAADAAAIAELGERLGRGLIVTLGERGVALRPAGAPDVTWIAPPSVQALDTTGAGDAFVGAFAVGLGLGWPADEAARLGCLAGADSVTRAGTQTSYAAPDAARAMLGTIRPS